MAGMSDQSEPGTDLVLGGAVTAVVAFGPGNAAKLLDGIERKAREEAAALDVSTRAGRDGLASLGLKVAKTKTAFDGMGKSLVNGWKKQAGVIDQERRMIRDRLDALKEEVRKPLTEYENADRDRIADHEAALAEIIALADVPADAAPYQIALRMDDLTAKAKRNWQEFSTRATMTVGQITDRLADLHAAATKREADAAELDRLRAEHAERERQESEIRQQEREDEIRRLATEQARLDAEARAAAELEESARREREAELARAAAQEAADRAEAARVAAVAKAEQDRHDAELRADAARVAAAIKAEADAAAAVEAERQRRADAKAAEEAETARRTADKAHRARVNNEAMAGLVAAGLDDKAARAAVIAIARGAVPHVTISY
jgi:hypothetical protein